MTTGVGESPEQRLDRLFELDEAYPACTKTDHALAHWCLEIDETIATNKDVIRHPGTVMIPIVPEQDLFAEVSIDANEKMVLKIQNTGELIDLGIWSPGEGRAIISDAVNTHMRYEFFCMLNNRSPRKCRSMFHGLTQELQYRAILEENDTEKKSAVFIMIHYEMCPPCFSKWLTMLGNLSSQQTNYGLAGVTSAAASSQVLQKAARRAGKNAAQASKATAQVTVNITKQHYPFPVQQFEKLIKNSQQI